MAPRIFSLNNPDFYSGVFTMEDPIYFIEENKNGIIWEDLLRYISRWDTDVDTLINFYHRYGIKDKYLSYLFFHYGFKHYSESLIEEFLSEIPVYQFMGNHYISEKLFHFYLDRYSLKLNKCKFMDCNVEEIFATLNSANIFPKEGSDLPFLPLPSKALDASRLAYAFIYISRLRFEIKPSDLMIFMFDAIKNGNTEFNNFIWTRISFRLDMTIEFLLKYIHLIDFSYIAINSNFNKYMKNDIFLTNYNLYNL
jgi:hypothetical protein